MTYLQKCLECREPSSDLSLVENIHTHIGQWRIYDTVSHSSCRSNFGPTIMLELKHIFTKKLFSMNWWVSYDYDFHWYLPLSSCHGFYLFLKKTKRIIYKQIEGFCIDTFENSAFENVVTYHESLCLFSPFCNEQDEIRHAATDRIQYLAFWITYKQNQSEILRELSCS